MANTNPFEVALKEARIALQAAYGERAAIEKKILNLTKSIDGLSALCEPEPDEEFIEVKGGNDMSLTDSIRRIFSESTEPILTPTEVRDALIAMGANLAKYKQPLVPIHNTLKRLVTQEELVEFRDDHNELKGYRWVSPLARAVAEVDSSPWFEMMKKAVGRNKNPAFYGEDEPTPVPHPSDQLKDRSKKK
jgi:hypothetical protein